MSDSWGRGGSRSAQEEKNRRGGGQELYLVRNIKRDVNIRRRVFLFPLARFSARRLKIHGSARSKIHFAAHNLSRPGISDLPPLATAPIN